MTANQVVAYNLRRAREERGWTQELAAQHLWWYLGKRWSKASFSAAERSADEDARKREFDANELLAFAVVFGQPIAYFFTLPDDVEDVTCGEPIDVSRHVGRGELLEVTPLGDITLPTHAKTLRKIADALDGGVKKENDDG